MPEHWQNVLFNRPSSSQSVAKEMSDLENLVEAKVTDVELEPDPVSLSRGTCLVSVRTTL